MPLPCGGESSTGRKLRYSFCDSEDSSEGIEWLGPVCTTGDSPGGTSVAGREGLCDTLRSKAASGFCFLAWSRTGPRGTVPGTAVFVGPALALGAGARCTSALVDEAYPDKERFLLFVTSGRSSGRT